MSATPDVYMELARRARRVVVNAFGTKARHTRAREGGCRDDCIPCGIEALRLAIREVDRHEAAS